MKKTIEFQIPSSFEPFAEPALVRASYLYPNVDINYQSKKFTVSYENTDSEIGLDQVKKEIFHQLYRSKIYQDTLGMKKWLFSDQDE